jgi:hypothetical protein
MAIAVLRELSSLLPGRHGAVSSIGRGLCVACFALWVGGFCPDAAAEIYQWKDAEGHVHYSDKVTAEEARHDRTKLDAKGMEKGFEEGAKSQEQIARENRLKELRREQLRLLVEERDHDEALRRTYHSPEDMVKAMQAKIQTLDGFVKVTQTNQQRQENILENQHRQAADLERRGQPVPKGLRDNIDATNRQIAAYKDKLRNIELDKVNIRETYKRDIERFTQLTAPQENPLQFLYDWAQAARPPREPAIVSAVSCQSAEVCDRIWNVARTYVLQNSNKPLFTDTGRLIRTLGPSAEGEIGLVVIRILGKNADTIFLDTRCRNSSSGDELCVSDQVSAIRSGFEPFIRKSLGLAP